MTDLTVHPIDQATDKPTIITIETALWALVVVVALALRLAYLDAAPLDGLEAREAMLAWHAVHDREMPRGDYSPSLFAANGLLFFLCGASDALARLWPALFGSALALLPFLLRRHVGRVGALAAGFLLAVSPTALFASRHVDGAVLAVTGGMVFFCGMARFSDTESRRWLTLSAVGLALALTSSSSAYGLLLIVVLAWMGLVRSGRLWNLLRPHVAHLLGVFFCATLVLSTGSGWNGGGLEATGGLLVAWFSRFGSPPVASAISPITLLALYEPLILVFSLGGLTWAVYRGRRFGLLLGLWAGFGTLMLSLSRARALDTLWVVLPLALLAGAALEALLRSLMTHRVHSGEWVYVLVTLVLWIYFYLRLARFAATSSSADLILAFLTLMLQVLFATVISYGFGAASTLRVGVVGIGAVLLAITLSAGWGVAYLRPADPQELLAREPTSIQVRGLVDTLRDLSWRRTGEATTLPFTYEAASDSVLAWYLRDFGAARRVESLGGMALDGADTAVLVTAQRDWRFSVGMPYVGQDFVLGRHWSPGEVGCIEEARLDPLSCSAFARWLLFRRTASPPVGVEWAVLWLRE